MAIASDLEIDIINDALALVGHPAIHDLNGDSPASEAAARLFPAMMSQLISAYSWRFSMKQRQLVQNLTKPLAKYGFSHVLPADRDGVPRRFYSDTMGTVIKDWEIYTANVHTNSSVVYCDYLKQGALTGPFRNVIVRGLAADFAMPLCDDKGMRDRFHNETFGTSREGGKGGLMGAAMAADAQGAEARTLLDIDPGPLVEALMS
jgi:hypothetical protein